MPTATVIEAKDGKIAKDRLLKGLSLQLTDQPSPGQAAPGAVRSYDEFAISGGDAIVKLSNENGSTVEVATTMHGSKPATVSFTPDQLLSLIPDLDVTVIAKMTDLTNQKPFDTSTYRITK